MIKFDSTVTLFKIESIQNEETGKRTKQILSQNKQTCSDEEVGLDTYYSAFANNVVLTRTISIRKICYRNEQYALFNDEVYEIERVGKGKTPQFINLPLKVCKDKEVIEVIKNAKGQ